MAFGTYNCQVNFRLEKFARALHFSESCTALLTQTIRKHSVVYRTWVWRCGQRWGFPFRSSANCLL